MSRADAIMAKATELRVRLTLYSKEEGGAEGVKVCGWGHPCFVARDASEPGYDGWPQLGNETLSAGQSIEVGYVFLSGAEAAEKFRLAGCFHVWDLGFIGFAEVIDSAT